MADEIVLKKIKEGVRYESLPAKVQQVISFQDWQHRVRHHCINRGLPWAGTLATAASSEPEYYELLIKEYKLKQRLYPYHMSSFIAGTLRITPFKYYYDIMYQAIRNELPYDQIPNFTAAEMVQMLGIGRNEYIAKLNACKEKKLLWRVNKAIAKEQLPTSPHTPKLMHWWRIQAVDLSEKEFRELTGREEAMLRQAAQRADGVAVAECEPDLLHSLYQRGLLYIDVPIAPAQRFSIPPLEGFVSNRDVVAGEGDPMEALLYELFVANSERLPLDELARILDKRLPDIQAAMSMACRLGFATPVEDGQEGGLGHDTALGTSPLTWQGPSDASAVAVVLDAEATSYLMMGSLSPGMKKHSVTLFEGGRLAGEDSIKDMRRELWASVEAGAAFEGEMAHIVGVIQSLAVILDTLAACVQSRSIELIRKESVSSLSPPAAARMLQHTYAAMLAIEPLPLPALPLPLSAGAGPALFGANACMLTPWLTLAVLEHLQRGPVSLAFARGQRITSLPPQAHRCTHALLWTWEPESWPTKAFGAQPIPHLIESKFLLYVLNGLLASSAVLLQPVWLPAAHDRDGRADKRGGSGSGKKAAGEPAPSLPIVQLPLPLHPHPDAQRINSFRGCDFHTRETVTVDVAPGLINTLRATGLEQALGYMWMVPLRYCSLPGTIADRHAAESYVPYSISLGVPVYNAALCKLVCDGAREAGLLTDAGIKRHICNQQFLLQSLTDFIQAHVAGSAPTAVRLTNKIVDETAVVLPPRDLVFDGHCVSRVDKPVYAQGLAVQAALL